jgi:hypothetical protein
MSEANGNGRLTPEQVEALLREELPHLKIDQGKIKFHEWEALEDTADRPVTPWIGALFPPMWFVRGQLWLRLRLKQPNLTYQDLADIDGDLLLEAMKLVKPKDEESDPTQGDAPSGDEPEPTTSPASAGSGE